MCSIFSHGNKVYVQRSIKTSNSRWMEAQDNMKGAKVETLESAQSASQQTHCEQTYAIDVDVTLTSKGLTSSHS